MCVMASCISTVIECLHQSDCVCCTAGEEHASTVLEAEMWSWEPKWEGAAGTTGNKVRMH